MPTNLIRAFETLEKQDQKLVEQLIYSLVLKVKSKTEENKNEKLLLSDLESLKGVLKECKYSSIEEARVERIAQKYGV